MQNIKISVKLTMSTLAFLLCILGLIYVFQRSIDSNIIFAEQEVKGTEYLRPVFRIFNKLADHQKFKIRREMGLGGFDNELKAASAEIDALFGDYQKVQNEMGVDLKFTEPELKARKRDAANVQGILSKWNELKQMQNNPYTPGLAEKYKSIIADLRVVITHAGDTSNLILDPDLDSYYMMDVVLFALPQTFDRQTQLANLVLSAFRGSLSEDERRELMNQIRIIKEFDVDRVAADMDTVFNEDANFYGISPTLKPNIEGRLEAYKKLNDELINTLNAIYQNPYSVNPAHAMDVLTQTFYVSADLLEASNNELEKFLKIRIDDYASHKKKVILICLLALGASLVFFHFTVKSILDPLKKLRQTMIDITEGKINTQVPYSNARSEIGEMARSVEVFRKNAEEKIKLEKEQEEKDRRAQEEKKSVMNKLASDFESNVKGVVDSVASASTEMSSTSKSVANIGEESAKRLNLLLAEVEKNTSNVHTVASASEELSASIKEIAQQVSRAATITVTTVEESKKADATAKNLVLAAQKIGEVINMINEIAGQINLLALNATIESARAGEAGKGFGVVASEVKNLATQTTKATDEIKGHIESIQNVTKDTVSVIGLISTGITEISGIASSISAAMEEQGAATQEISRSIQQVAQTTEEVSNNVKNVAQSVTETGTSAGQMMAATGELSRQAEFLKGQVGKFLGNIRTGT